MSGQLFSVGSVKSSDLLNEDNGGEKPNRESSDPRKTRTKIVSDRKSETQSVNCFVIKD